MLREIKIKKFLSEIFLCVINLAHLLRWARFMLAIVSGFSLGLSLNYPHLSMLAWVGFVPLFFCLKNMTLKQSFCWAYFSGIIFFTTIIYWLRHVTIPGVIILVLYLAFYFGLFGMFIYFWHQSAAAHRSKIGNANFAFKKRCREETQTFYKKKNFFFLPCAWIVLEFLRSLLSYWFGWGLLGYSQYENLAFIQSADTFGVWGVSFLVMLGNVFLFKVIIFFKQQIKHTFNEIIGFTIIILIFISVYGYGIFRLKEKKDYLPFRVSVIQGNIPQEEKWDERFKELIMQRYKNLTLNAKRDAPELIIWPETSLPGYWGTDSDVSLYMKDLVSITGTPLLFGTPQVMAANGAVRYFNSAILLGRDAKMINYYNKLHLVPFGEYIPFEKLFGFIRKFVYISDFSPGEEFTIFNLGGRKFAVLICFEDVLPNLVRRFVRPGTHFLVNITNDAWFKKSRQPYQHLQASVFRAVENRRPVIRSANTGISAFIDNKGRITDKVSKDSQDTFIEGDKTEEINIALINPVTIYNEFGDWFIYWCAGYLLIDVILKKGRL
ncbi:MAG: apolipoprotein N-acyltransferase [Candidatus Omnitrophota bacterium]